MEEITALCGVTTGCQKERLYLGSRFDTPRCVRNCNCGAPLEDAIGSWEEVLEVIAKPKTLEDAVPKFAIEYQYQKILAKSKRSNKRAQA